MWQAVMCHVTYQWWSRAVEPCGWLADWQMMADDGRGGAARL